MRDNRRDNMQRLLAEREEFLLIAMTGRVGSGCTETARILESDVDTLRIAGIEGRLDKIKSDDERDKRILGEYAQAHWLPFDVIKTRTVITTFLLSNMQGFANEVLKVSGAQGEKDFLKKLIKSTKEELEKRLCELYEEEPFQEVAALFAKCDIDVEAWEQFRKVLRDIYKKLNRRSDNFKKLYKSCEDLMKEGAELFGDIYRKNLWNIKYKDHNTYLRNVNKCLYMFSSMTAYLWFADNSKETRDVWDKLSEINERLDKEYDFLCFTFVHDMMPALAKVIHKRLCDIGLDVYTRFFQKYGNYIRRFGKIVYNREIIKQGVNNQSDIFEIPRKINHFIKILRHPFGRDVSRPERIVIDSLKNPFEALYLRERYSAFYMFAISTDENIRRNRMKQTTRRLADTQINLMDWNEYSTVGYNILGKYKRSTRGLSNDQIEFARNVNGETEEDEYDDVLFDHVRKEAYNNVTYQFILQDIENCIQNADVFISNTGTAYNKNEQLKWDVIRSVCLILYPGLVQPTPIERCMQIAFSAKVNSGCISRQVGAVVTDSDYNILSIGWNDVPCGDVSCSRKNLGDLCKSYMRVGSTSDKYTDDSMDDERTDNERSTYTDYELNDNAFRERAQVKYERMQGMQQELCGLPMRYCFKDVSSDVREPMKSRAMHGEEKALAMCGKECEGGFLFTTSSPCEMCSKNAKNHKIKKIYYIEPYPGVSEEQYSNSGDMANRAKHILYTGAVGRAYTQMYTPIMPHKDIMANLI